MTARHQIRFGHRRLVRDRSAIDAIPAPRLGEMLQLARENKGVDRFRAERDTKIRLRHLAALEDSEYHLLPAAVYTKGFLRNYAIYLGLEPDDVLVRWREEMQAVRRAERPTVAPPPRPLTTPRRGLTLTPGLFMAGLLGLVVLGFTGFIALQLMRAAETTSVTLTNPPSLVSEVNSERILLTGISQPGAAVTIHGPGEQLYSTTANETGSWSREVPLTHGHNDFRIDAMDPVTRRPSDPLNVIVTVPLPARSPAASPTALAPAPIELDLRSPAGSTQEASRRVTVSGTTSATRVTIIGEYIGPPGGEPALPPPSPAGSPAASAAPAAADTSELMRDVTVPPTGLFSEEFELTAGPWRFTVTASSAGLAPLTETRTVTVEPPKMTLEISVVRRQSQVRVVADGEVVPGYDDRRLRAGESHTFEAANDIWLQASNAGVLRITLDGQEMGRLGKAGQGGNWIIRVGQEPEQTTDTR
jgi:cytoskeletal protein RodZ